MFRKNHIHVDGIGDAIRIVSFGEGSLALTCYNKKCTQGDFSLPI